MNDKYFVQIIESSRNIIKQVTGFSSTAGEITIKKTPYKSEKVLIMIGLTGKISGCVVITLREKFACQIASKMMYMDVNELDEVTISAISELCNMILGNAVTELSVNGLMIDITPPTMITGDNIQLSPHKSNIESVSLTFDNGSILEIDISYVER